MLAGNASVAKNINWKHTVVYRREWLYKLTKFFVDCFCSSSWPSRCTKSNFCYSCIGWERKTKDCAWLYVAFQHKSCRLCLILMIISGVLTCSRFWPLPCTKPGAHHWQNTVVFFMLWMFAEFRNHSYPLTAEFKVTKHPVMPTTVKKGLAVERVFSDGGITRDYVLWFFFS